MVVSVVVKVDESIWLGGLWYEKLTGCPGGIVVRRCWIRSALSNGLIAPYLTSQVRGSFQGCFRG